MRKALLFILLFLALPMVAIDVDYRLSLRSGMIMPDGKVDATAGENGHWIGPSIGAEFAASFRPKWQSLDEWNDARIGVALSYWKLNAKQHGADDILGHAIAPYAFLEIPFYKSPHFEIGIRPGFGCSFITRTYFNTATPAQQYVEMQAPGINQSVGSVFNYYFPEAFYLNFPLRDGWVIGFAGGWYHMSNGSMIQPNSGFNIFSGELNLSYRPPVPDKDDAPTPPKQEYSLEVLRRHHCEIEFAFCAAPRQVYYKDRQTFFCGDFQLAAYWRAHRIFRLGGGIDVFYDGAYYDRGTQFKKTYLTGATQADCWRMGISIQPEFVVGHFTAGVHFGVYLLDPVKNRELSVKDGAAYEALWKEGILANKGIFYPYDAIKAGSAGYPDGWLYMRIAMRYRLPWHLFVQGDVKVHLTKVEFIGFGLGCYL